MKIEKRSQNTAVNVPHTHMSKMLSVPNGRNDWRGIAIIQFVYFGSLLLFEFIDASDLCVICFYAWAEWYIEYKKIYPKRYHRYMSSRESHKCDEQRYSNTYKREKMFCHNLVPLCIQIRRFWECVELIRRNVPFSLVLLEMINWLL